MLKEAKQAYQSDSAALKKVLEFETEYSPVTAVRWCTRDCFLFRLVNKAMRTQDIVEIYKYRWFIYDLQEQLHQLYSVQAESFEVATVHRGQLISFEELEWMRTSCDKTVYCIRTPLYKQCSPFYISFASL